MRFATIETPSGPRAVVRQGDEYVDLHATDASLSENLREYQLTDPALLKKIEETAQKSDAVKHPVQGAEYHSPIIDPRKIICVGLNYWEHAMESGAKKPPTEPILFCKYSVALTGHEKEIVLPPVSDEVDYEAELVVVIGKEGRPTKENALDYVSGYSIGHDVSARDWQLKKEGKQWTTGKTFPTFAPVGPELVTKDEVPDPHKLSIALRLNGETMQDSNTEIMIFKIGDILEYLSQIFPLEVGDLIFTGTPPGVGFARTPPVFLKDGDVTEVEIEKLGILRSTVTAAR